MTFQNAIYASSMGKKSAEKPAKNPLILNFCA